MLDQPLMQLLLLLGAAIALVWVFQRLQAPPVLGYLLVEVMLGLFFVGIRMLFDLSALPDVWYLAARWRCCYSGSMSD